MTGVNKPLISVYRKFPNCHTVESFKQYLWCNNIFEGYALIKARHTGEKDWHYASSYFELDITEDCIVFMNDWDEGEPEFEFIELVYFEY